MRLTPRNRAGDHWQPQSGRALLQQPIVSVLGSKSQRVDLDGSWYISAASDATGGESTVDASQLIQGTTLVSAQMGTATFTDLRFDTSANCQRIAFALGTLSAAGQFQPEPALRAVSLPFEVSIGDPSQIVMVQQPGGVATGQVLRSVRHVYIIFGLSSLCKSPRLKSWRDGKDGIGGPGARHLLGAGISSFSRSIFPLLVRNHTLSPCQSRSSGLALAPIIRIDVEIS
jgi:hypothetical protein